MFTVSHGATSWFQHNVCEQRWVLIGNLNNLPSEFSFIDDPNFGDFTLLFCRRRQRNVQSFKTHVLSYCSDICSFVLLRPRSLPSHSYFAEGPYLLIQALRNIRHRRKARTARGLRVQQCFWNTPTKSRFRHAQFRSIKRKQYLSHLIPK